MPTIALVMPEAKGLPVTALGIPLAVVKATSVELTSDAENNRPCESVANPYGLLTPAVNGDPASAVSAPLVGFTLKPLNRAALPPPS